MRDALLAAALHHRAASCLLAAEICYRAALSAEAICASCANAFLDDSRYCRRCGSARPAAADLWFGLSTVLLERGAFAAARLAFEHARSLATEEDQAVGGNARLLGLCEFFAALEALQGLQLDGAAKLSSPAPVGTNNHGATQRAAHIALYYRSLVATEAGSWETLAALGEYYRLIGCPELHARGPAPDQATAMSYFRQAQGHAPGAFPFIEDRISRLALCEQRVAGEA